MKNLFKKYALVAIFISVFYCSDDDKTPAQQTITEIAVANPDF
jgi:peptidoglycan biosynthesis protein MviN/MurJ (putative lipid II flippase)